jgi:imidazolonepropionase-like amidohydrolase
MFPGKSAHVELRALVRAGLTPYQALAAGTRVPGAFLQAHTQTQPLGTVTLGSRGDLILLHANPLDDVTVTDSIVGVLVAGRWLPIDSLKAMRRAAAALPR